MMTSRDNLKSFLLAVVVIAHTGTAFSTTKGFGAPQPKQKIVAKENVAEQTARSLFGVCSHLQNPELYSPPWSNMCHVNEDGILVAAKNILRGDIVSFYPVHSLGLRGLGKKQNKRNNQRQSDYLVFDSEQDGNFFGSSRRTTKYCIDFPAMTNRPELRGQSLFLDVNPDRKLVQGWLGHLCKKGDNQNSNCAAIPIDEASPLCMVVATCDIPMGEILTRDIATNEGEVLVKKQITKSGDMALKKYEVQIAELRGFTDMVYANKEINSLEEKGNGQEEVQCDQALKFKKINMDYPGLKELHKDPDIYAVDKFLTADESNRIIAKCKPKMAPCVTKDPLTGSVGPDSSRTSTEAMLPRTEAPSVVSKLTSLLDCKEEQLEILQVLRYEKGQEFKLHTDGFQGPVTAAGFENSGRLVTIFTYLNDVKEGGHTNFPELSLSVAPKQGSTVVHFPAAESLEEDKRTIHQGMPAIDEKWLLTTWIWQHERTDERYAESRLPKLSEDII